ncbi:MULTISPECIES: efflux RND transporter periplasmic adaptor subunit [Pseudomonas]|uniref:efflux RND transporter periplasmic adaptor subunit n=1 Tax=Pseudomonas TaxID=286 RepID=UPI0006D48080|nr:MULTISPECIES: efflux RND transporter periplasmic adaptor subunit [Pseudomonas]MCE4069408.1 efflux RND transporter periplasmic adaptor subunit [Pseudomonas nitritireducens]MCE4079428.1 efflux RND transporter periplasmic adaptor subunit [Pseudomonas nitroreducens]OBY92042.1 efflux transporter periplasmic adaptor subunit [Pseudomonas sp. AU11447]
MHKGIWLGLGLSLCAFGAAHAAQPGQDDPLLSSPSTSSGAGDVRGILRARDQAMLSSELAGRILEMPFAEGQSFRKGDVLVRFDCSAYQAQLNAAQAGAKAASEQLAHNRQLAALNSVGRFEVALAEAKLAEAQAQAQVYQVQVRRCALTAPYDGQVVQRKAQPFESVSGGAPLLEIVDNRSLEIRLLVPSRWVARLKAGQSFTFVPDETGEPLQAEVKRLGARIDEGSQMLPLIATLPAETKGLLAGMSGTARFAETP